MSKNLQDVVSFFDLQLLPPFFKVGSSDDQPPPLASQRTKFFSQSQSNCTKYSYLYENDHFNQAQAEFKKELNGQSKPVAQKKKKEKKEGVYHALREWLECMVHTLGPFESQHCPSFTIRCSSFFLIISVTLVLT